MHFPDKPEVAELRLRAVFQGWIVKDAHKKILAKMPKDPVEIYIVGDHKKYEALLNGSVFMRDRHSTPAKLQERVKQMFEKQLENWTNCKKL